MDSYESEIFLNVTENGENLDVTTESYTPVGVTSVNGKKGKVILTSSDLENTSDYQTGSEVRAKIAQAVEQHNNDGQAHPAIRNTINGKQDKLVSGVSIKTINNESILGSGNLNIGGNIGTITSVKMNGSTIATSGEADLGTVITQHQDISGKLDVSKVKNTTSRTAGDVYDVTYINTMIGNIETILTILTIGRGVE